MSVPAVPDPAVTLIRLRVEYEGGAFREYTARHPHGFQLLVGATADVAGLPPGLSDEQRKEPRIGVMFSGNPEAGGVEVDQAGVL